ncbi:hypothetical protein BV898_19155 [Hypsibius exemplaris]|uniref:Nuclear receptor domain-containing protein n=1 Tax=Hypsibius exemplaris TaxID=2072580 RepID=A0A9X6RPG6_HYPEX|nr:hypothetical protein BV898_19155 [Hypsibius exemplaris]
MKCKICSRDATGVHYGVLACEGCKAFYRRGVEKNIKFLCYFGNKCTTRPNTRANCKSCRFEKCKSLGMKLNGPKRREKVAAASAAGNQETKGSDQSQSNSYLTGTDPASGNGSATPPNLQEFLSLTPPVSMDFDDQFVQFNNSPLFNTSILPITAAGEDVFGELQVLPDLLNLDGNNDMESALWDVLTNSNNQTSNNNNECALMEIPNLLTFMDSYMNMLDDNNRQMILTVQSVASVVEAVFGDQLSSWKMCMELALTFGEPTNEPEPDLEAMLEAHHEHNADSVARILKFVSYLPGANELDATARMSVCVGWKWMAFWLIHHAAFLNEEETFILMGPNQLRYNRYWQEKISEGPLLSFIYTFGSKFREIGLTQTETYLLLAVIFFEPEADVRKLVRTHSSTAANRNRTKLELIHRHYADTLFHAIRQRCSDSEQLSETCSKLEDCFGALQLVHRIHRHYLRALDLAQTPFRAIKGNHIITVQEALTCYEDPVDPDEFDARSPMTYKIRNNSIVPSA